jgi:predicted house-cleaning NTP pyrophosphatase (Maf/HAM1 superfamily)
MTHSEKQKPTPEEHMKNVLSRQLEILKDEAVAVKNETGLTPRELAEQLAQSKEQAQASSREHDKQIWDLKEQISTLTEQRKELLEALKIAYAALMNENGDDLAPRKTMNLLTDAIAKAKGTKS